MATKITTAEYARLIDLTTDYAIAARRAGRVAYNARASMQEAEDAWKAEDAARDAVHDALRMLLLGEGSLASTEVAPTP